jgi:hypothetical protein
MMSPARNTAVGLSRPLCPSAQPDWPTAAIIGVVGGAPEQAAVAFLDEPAALTAELLALAEPLQPTEVFRFTAPCASASCRHFGEGRCRLASKIVHLLPRVTSELPPCAIRARCRWWVQEGRAACMRCPQVVTQDGLQSEAWQKAADPELMPEAVGSRDLRVHGQPPASLP